MAHELTVPSVGESITEVYIGRWHKAVGDTVQSGDVLVEIESDKAMIELPAPHAGTLTQILKNDGDEAQVGEVIAMLEAGDVPVDAAAPAEEAPAAPAEQAAEAPAAAPATPAPTPATPAPASPAAADGADVIVMPAAQRLLTQYGLTADGIQATGFGGRLLKEDVERAVRALAQDAATAVTTGGASGEAAPAPAALAAGMPGADAASREERVERMSPIRRRIAERLVDAQQTAALLTTFNEIDMTKVMNMRRTHQDAFTEKHGTRLGFMSFFVKASVAALQLIPEVNAEIRDDSIVYRDYCDIGIAVGGGRGLVVPVIRNAERLGFGEIETTILDFATRAQDNTLGIDEMQGGTFTISNGGVYGSLLSTPIVNPPQSGILGLHRIQQRPVVVDGEIVIRNMMYIALTYDHRIIDGREAVTFLKHIKELMEDPERMLLEV